MLHMMQIKRGNERRRQSGRADVSFLSLPRFSSSQALYLCVSIFVHAHGPTSCLLGAKLTHSYPVG